MIDVGNVTEYYILYILHVIHLRVLTTVDIV